MRYLRRIGYFGTPTYHALAAQLAKSDDATRETLAAGYWQWVDLLRAGHSANEGSTAFWSRDADPRQLALVIVSAHQGGGTLAFTYRAEWPHADAVRFAVNYLRMFAADTAERVPRPAAACPRSAQNNVSPLTQLCQRRQRERRQRIAVHSQGTGDPGADRRRRRASHVRTRRRQHQHRPGAAHAPGWADRRSRTTSATNAI